MSTASPDSGKNGETQLDFIEIFQITFNPKWTRVIPFYDVFPKFLFAAVKKFTTAHANEGLKFTCHFDDRSYEVLLTPAHVNDVETPFFCYPGEREELVSRAIRYLAVQNKLSLNYTEKNPQSSDQIRVYFTLHQIIKLLSQWGHTYNSKEIDEALSILSKTNLTVKADSKQAYTGNLISYYRDDTDPNKQRRMVILNDLECQAIKNGSHRALNFERLMTLQSPLARRLYEFVMTRHLGAEKPSTEAGAKPPRPFELRLSTILQEGCIQPEKRLRDTIVRVRSAIKELATKGVLWDQNPFEEYPHMEGTKGRRKIVDVTWQVRLSLTDVKDLISASAEIAMLNDPVISKSRPKSQLKTLRRQAKDKHL